MPASDSSLHPHGKKITAGEIHFTLRDAACVGEDFAVECVYRPYRERDVIKHRSLQLLDSLFRSGSGNFINVQREEFHSVRQQIRATDTTAKFTVALRDPDAAHEAYQLASVRIVSSRAGTLEFERWFDAVPALDSGFGFTCTAEALRGAIRPSGLGALPLRGSLPLWPTLRTVDITFASVETPTVQLWDAMAKHHWDGWRQATPQAWPGGRSTVARHIGGPTVWRANDYHAYAPASEPPVARPVPPAGALPGVALEIYWPEGDTLEFPEVRFDQPADMIALPLARLTPRAGELLATSMTLRPGVEHGSLTAAEWDELADIATAPNDVAVTTKMKTTAEGKDVMVIHRGKLREPWLCIFGVEYDEERRSVLTSLVLNPAPWSGPLPE